MNKEILRLAIPNIISNLSVPLLSSFDTALMGRLTEIHIGAVGIGAMIFNFVYWNFGFLRMGTTGITAQAFGREDNKGIIETFGRANVVAIIVAITILVFQQPLVEASIYLLNISGEQRPIVEEYYYIRVWAAPATIASYAFMGWFFGMQNAVYPLIMTVVVNVVNMALSYFFVMELGMEAAGVAWGTVIAQYVGVLLGLGLFFYKYSYLLNDLERAVLLKKEAFKGFLKVNGDIFIRTFFLTFVFGFFYSQSSKGGDMILAVNVILLNFLNWMSYGVDGFAFASESLVGKYKGAADQNKLKKAIRLSFVWGMVLAGIFSLVYWLGGEAILRLFTDQEDVIMAATPFLFWMAIFPLLSTACYIWDGVYIGLTASRAMRNTMMIAFIFYLGVHFSFDKIWGNNHALWLALLIFMVARGAIQHLFFLRRGTALQ
jgi:MATE family multidrug resistance protein